MQINEELYEQSQDKLIDLMNPQILQNLADTSFYIAIVQNIMILAFI